MENSSDIEIVDKFIVLFYRFLKDRKIYHKFMYEFMKCNDYYCVRIRKACDFRSFILYLINKEYCYEHKKIILRRIIFGSLYWFMTKDGFDYWHKIHSSFSIYFENNFK